MLDLKWDLIMMNRTELLEGIFSKKFKNVTLNFNNSNVKIWYKNILVKELGLLEFLAFYTRDAIEIDLRTEVWKVLRKVNGFHKCPECEEVFKGTRVHAFNTMMNIVQCPKCRLLLEVNIRDL